MKIDDYVNYILGADSAPAMQLRILEYYNDLITNSSTAYSVGETLRSRLNENSSLCIKLRIKNTDLVDMDAIPLFPCHSGGKSSWLKPTKIINIFSHNNSCVRVEGVDRSTRLAYRYKLNYVANQDPMWEAFALPVNVSS